ncbi:MAG: cysteine--tRNA ligase [Candidatus Pacebacteria bacterium]|nr:cysteine--tRNA ligase [Candidatus Paceibacterota bacterium]
MKLYNTLSKAIEEIKVPEGKELGLYACGPTVYDYTHLGHLRKYTLDDVLVRALRKDGYKVKHVQNITDVGHLSDDGDEGEDKLEKGAKKYGESVWDIAKRFENYFWHSMDLIGVEKPDISCRATDHIEQQLEMVKTLEKKGFAYVIDGDGVYFDTSKLDDYGKLARLKLDDLKEGARVETKGKKNPTDFALWKFERKGENRAMVWDSPWHERSFPGWHIECSAMGMHYLGDQFEIHTGGIDHIPVHHTNEIAQAEASSGKKPFVKVWVHHNFLQIEGEKMSKSLGNVFNIDDVVEKGFDPEALRLLFLTGHYRSEMNFTWNNLAGSQKAWNRLLKMVMNLRDKVKSDEVFSEKGQSKLAANYSQNFYSAINNDLNTAQAIATMWDMMKDSKLPGREKLFLLFDFDSVLGLGLEEASLSKNATFKGMSKVKAPQEVLDLLEQRDQARKDQKWEKSDSIRDQIAELGYKVTDGSNGQEVEKL